MASYELDALAKLLPLSWRGIIAPCGPNSLTFNQRTAEHKQYGVAGSHLENTGRDSAKFSFRVYFRGGISGHQGYHNLYPQRYIDFFNACLDGSTGKLIHPEFGELDAKVIGEVKVNYDPNRRDGVDIDVVWGETNENEYTLEQFGIVADAINLASDLEEMEQVAFPKEFLLDENGLSISESLKKIQGSIQSLDMSIGAIEAQIGNVVNTLNNFIDFINTESDPNAWAIADQAKQVEALCAATIQALPGMSKSKKVDMKITTTEETCARCAGRYGLSLNDFFALNPMYASTGTVPNGSTVFVYVS